MSELADSTCLVCDWRVPAPADSTRLMGASSASEPADLTRVSEPADQTRLMAVSDPADPTRSISMSDPALVPKCNDDVSSESDVFTDSTEAALTAQDLLPIPPNAESAFLATSDPLVGAALVFRVTVMLSGPLESELPRMNIFWCAGGGEIVTSDDCWG